MVVISAGVGDSSLLAGEAELVPSIGVLEGLGLVRIAPVAKVGVGIHDFHVSMVLKVARSFLTEKKTHVKTSLLSAHSVPVCFLCTGAVGGDFAVQFTGAHHQREFFLQKGQFWPKIEFLTFQHFEAPVG